MRLYVRYILAQLALPALIATIACSGAVWLSQSLRFVDLIVNKGLPATTFLYLTLLLFPSLLLIILPFALFCAVLFVYHRLTVESELTVMKAVGLSNWQLAAPCLLLAGIFTLAGYTLSLYVMPLAYRSFKDLQQQIRQDFSYVLLQPGVFNSPLKDVAVYIKSVEPDGSLRGILVHDSRKPNAPSTLMAEQGFLVEGDQGALFVLERGTRQEQESSEDREGAMSILHFDRYTLDLASTSATRSDALREPEELFIGDLLDPKDPRLSLQARQELIAQGHRRLTWPLNTMVLALIGLAALLSPGYDRQGPWRRTAVAIVAAIVMQSASMAAGSLAAASPALIPLVYLTPALGALAAVVALQGWRPPRRMAPARAS